MMAWTPIRRALPRIRLAFNGGATARGTDALARAPAEGLVGVKLVL